MSPSSATAPPGRPEPLPPEVGAALENVRRGEGGFVLCSGGTPTARQRFREGLTRAVKEERSELLELRAYPSDAIIPYGALQPWLAQWYEPSASPAPGPAKPRGTISMPLIGLLLGLPPEGLPEGTPSLGGGAAAGGADPARSFTPAELRSELIDLVQGRTRKAAAVVLIEDADFLDPSSREWFSVLSTHIARLPLLIVLTVDRDAEVWRSRIGAAPTVACPLAPGETRESYAERLRTRLRAMPRSSLEALALVVLAGPDGDVDLLREAAQHLERGARFDQLIAPAVNEGWVRRVGAFFECPDPSLYPDLLGSLSAATLASIHRALAQAVSAGEGPPQGRRLFRLGEHWAAAGDVGRGVPTLLQASREAERWGSPELAAQRLQRAVGLAQGDPSPRGREAEERSCAELAALRLRAGEPRLAVEAYERALKLAKARGTTVVHWGRYVAGIADAQAGIGEHPEELLRHTLSEVEGRAPDVEALLLRSLAFYYIERARFREAIPVAERACLAADRGHDELLQVQCHSTLARSLIYVGERSDEARAHLLKALEHRAALEGTADQVMIVGLLDGLSLLECGVGNEEASLRWGEEALEMSRRCGYGTSFLWVLGNLAEEHIHMHSLERAQTLLEEFRRLLVRLAVPESESLHQQLYLLEGRMALESGDLPTARLRFQRIVQEAERGGSRVLLAQGLVHLVVLEVRAGDLEAARRQLRQLERSGLDRSLMGETRRLLDGARQQLAAAR